MKPKVRTLLKNIAYTILITGLLMICLLYGTEFYLRNTDPFFDMPFDHIYYTANRSRYEGRIKLPADAGEHLCTWGHKVVENEFRMREKEVTTPKSAGIRRIMVLGDSFTWGAGLAIHERYSNQLDSMLKIEFPQHWEVLNFGFAGCPTVQERNLLRKVKNSVQPDLIVVGFCPNDPQPKRQNHSVEREMFVQHYGPTLNAMKLFLKALGLRHFGSLVESFTYRIAERLNYIPEWEVSLNRAYDKRSQEWKDFIAALADIKSMSDSMNCPTPVFAAFNYKGSITIPENISNENSLDKHFHLRQGWIKQALAAADSIGFNTVSYDQEFTKRLRDGTLKLEQLTVNRLDDHPSAGMNKIYAKLIFETIKKKVVPILDHRQ